MRYPAGIRRRPIAVLLRGRRTAEEDDDKPKVSHPTKQ
jgi:hypothetical protein